MHVFFVIFTFFSSNAKYSCRKMFRATHWKQTMKYRMSFPVSLTHAPLLLNVKDSETVVTASVSNPPKDKKLKWTYTIQTPGRYILCQWGVSTLYTKCCACLSSSHLTQLLSNDTVDPHIASHSMSFYLRDCTPLPSHFVESRITYNPDRMDYIEIAPSPTSPLHLKTKEARR